MLVASRAGLDILEFDNERTVEKVRARSTEIWDRVKDERSGRVEDRFIEVAVEFTSTEAAAGNEPTGGIGEVLRQVAKIIEADLPRVARRGYEVANLARRSTQCRGPRVD
jgi:hypothetical protein